MAETTKEHSNFDNGRVRALVPSTKLLGAILPQREDACHGASADAYILPLASLLQA